jgi:hypothetical protein
MGLPWSAEAKRRRRNREREEFETRTPSALWWAMGSELGKYPGKSNDGEEARALMLHYVRKIHGLDLMTGRDPRANPIRIETSGAEDGHQHGGWTGSGGFTLS